jgi:hypothetical protein
MQRLEVSGAVRPLKWPLGVKWLIRSVYCVTAYVICSLVDFSNRVDREFLKCDEFLPLEKLSKGKTIQIIYTPPVEYQRVYYITVARVRRETVELCASSCALNR